MITEIIDNNIVITKIGEYSYANVDFCVLGCVAWSGRADP